MMRLSVVLLFMLFRPAFAEVTAEQLADQALGVPAELGADVLLRLAETDKFQLPAKRVNAIESAFSLAKSARHPYPISGTLSGISTDSDAGVAILSISGFNTLSLQARAITLMLSLNKARAMTLFASIPNPAPPALTCKDSRRAVLTPYYDLLKRVYESGFSDAERKKGLPLALLLEHIKSLSSPLQLEPVARLLRSLKLSKPELVDLLAAYSTAMKRITSDDRSFTSATTLSFNQAFNDLQQEASRQEIPTLPLADGFRSYLVRHLSAPSCADSIDRPEVAKIVDLFNRTYAQESQGQIAPISAQETKPGHNLEQRFEIYNFWQKPGTRTLQQDLIAMAADFRNKKPDDPVWERVPEFLKQLESWKKQNDETPGNYFHQICFAYLPLIEMIPTGSLRNSVISAFVGFLHSSEMQRNNPPEWLMEYRRLMAIRGLTPADKKAILDIERAAGDPVMTLYLDLDTLGSNAAPNR